VSDPERLRIAGRLALYLVLDPEQVHGDVGATASDALDGGVTAIQLRAKRLTDRTFLALAHDLCARCRAHGALFTVNDRLDIALASGADGVHLGVDDLPVAAVRRIAPARLIVGYSPETDDQAASAAGEGADYLGVGPVFGTNSKPDAGEAIGLDTLARRVELAGIPVVGIGGIDAGSAGSVIAAGAVGVAVVGAVLRAGDPRAAANALAAAVGTARSREPARHDG
jgi:thiamine-phosphate pyrophosphorylase